MSQGTRKIFVVILIAIQVIISQAAPADDTADAAVQPVADASAAAADASAAAADAQPNAAADVPTASQGTSEAQVSAGEPTGDKPTKPGSKPTNGVTKPTNGVTKPTNGATKPSSGNKPFSSCWSCLLQSVDEICSYLTDWTSPKRIPTLNLFSLFHERSSEESTENSYGTPSIASLFRFKRSAEDPAKAQDDFLELLDGFYLKARERFARENPGSVSAALDNPFNKPDEMAQVVAYVLGVTKGRLVEVFEKMKTRRTGEILLQALSDRRSVLSGEENLDDKGIGGLTPTSISYFFKELLGSFNGVATGLSEIMSIVLQNQNTNVQANRVI